MDFASSVNGLVVVTSATLAIAKYFDDEHKDGFLALKDSIKDLDFNGFDGNAGIQQVKHKWDELRIKKPRRLVPQIAALMILLICCPLIHLLILKPELFSVISDQVANIVAVLFGLQFVIAIWSVWWLMKMGAERSAFSRDINNLQMTHSAVRATLMAATQIVPNVRKRPQQKN